MAPLIGKWTVFVYGFFEPTHAPIDARVGSHGSRPPHRAEFGMVHLPEIFLVLINGHGTSPDCESSASSIASRHPFEGDSKLSDIHPQDDADKRGTLLLTTSG